MRHLPLSFFIGVALSIFGMVCLTISYLRFTRPRPPRPIRLNDQVIQARLAQPQPEERAVLVREESKS